MTQNVSEIMVTSLRLKWVVCEAVLSPFRIIEYVTIRVYSVFYMKHLLCLLTILSFGALAAPVAQAITPIALPVGDWSVNANGSHGVLHISGIDAAGNIQAGSTIYGNTIVGFYDSTSGRISFIRVMESSPTFEQIYNGYLFKDIPNPTLSYLAGSFAAYQGGGGVALRMDYGWYASKLAIVILK